MDEIINKFLNDYYYIKVVTMSNRIPCLPRYVIMEKHIDKLSLNIVKELVRVFSISEDEVKDIVNAWSGVDLISYWNNVVYYNSIRLTPNFNRVLLNRVL